MVSTLTLFLYNILNILPFEGFFFCVEFWSFSSKQENQVMALKEKGIAADFLSSTQTTKVRDQVKFQKLGYIICVLNLC